MLDFDAVTKRFGPVMALDRCAVSVRPGQLTGFLGPNGAGKTTAMRAVFGLVDLDEGAVRWHGRPVRPADRARFGYMPEERGLYPRMRVRDQLVYLGQLCGRGPGDVRRSVDSWPFQRTLTVRQLFEESEGIIRTVITGAARCFSAGHGPQIMPWVPL